ncbi:MAG: hypothetical protein NT030_08445, partial [Candidatus Saganbacteria bacterium]|nr:hypothetical protein [Candidatus Saganbacteria bacterium]
AYCYIHDYKSGKDYEIVDSTGITLTLDPDNPIESDCSHLFPTDKSGDQVGSNSFGKTREKLFGTSPYNADTLGAGEKDEAMATGLGIKDLTWKYQPGDKVGVVVEGVSMNATKFNDSSLMIMWSLPNDDQHCTLDDLTDDYAPSSEQDSFMFFLDPLSITNNVESLRVATLNEDGLNTCLENNMKEPTEGGNAQPLEVSLSSTPDNPMADDLISVQSSFDNYSKDSSQLSYEWTITPKDEDGNDITADDGVKVAGTAPFLKGNNLASVSFRLKGNSDNLKKVKSVSVKLIISDYFIPGNTTDTLTKNQKGSASLDIDLNPAGQKIKIYQAASSDGEKVTHDSSKELCTEASSQGCAVLNNQVVEAEVDNATDLGNFSWTLNGNPLYCSDSMSSECGADTQGNVVFFAISAEEGQTLELTLNTKNTSPDSSGQSMTLNKKFIVVAPSVKIETDGTSAWPKYLGEYTPLNSQDCVDPNDATKDLCADYSQSVFETGSGNSVALSAKFSPEWLEDDPNLEIVWTIDGETANSSGFTAGDIGGVHNVQINATYTYPEAMRKILNKFAVSQLDSGEKEFSDAAQIEV